MPQEESTTGRWHANVGGCGVIGTSRCDDCAMARGEDCFETTEGTVLHYAGRTSEVSGCQHVTTRRLSCVQRVQVWRGKAAAAVLHASQSNGCVPCRTVRGLPDGLGKKPVFGFRCAAMHSDCFSNFFVTAVLLDERGRMDD